MFAIKSFLLKYKLSKFIYLLIDDFISKDGLDRVNSLAFTILMSFVPFLISMASLAALFMPINTYLKFENFILDKNLPAMGDQISHYMRSFHKHAGQLSLMSFAFLCFSAILMIRSLTKHLGQLYDKESSRANLKASIKTIAILIIASLLFVIIGVGLNSYISLAMKNKFPIIINLLSLFLSIIAFTIIYKFVPIKKVNFYHALIAGVIAGILFEIAKYGFDIYIKYFATENILYGTLATIPIFLLWLYISCLILLLCANITSVLKKHHNKNKI